jgi:hypothetical protein
VVGATAPSLGKHLDQIQRHKEMSRTVIANAKFAAVPPCTGNPWFVSLAMKWFDRQDRRAGWG